MEKVDKCYRRRKRKIAKIAEKYDVYIGAVAGLFQGGMTFEEIERKLKSEENQYNV